MKDESLRKHYEENYQELQAENEMFCNNKVLKPSLKTSLLIYALFRSYIKKNSAVGIFPVRLFISRSLQGIV